MKPFPKITVVITIMISTITTSIDTKHSSMNPGSDVTNSPLSLSKYFDLLTTSSEDIIVVVGFCTFKEFL